MSPQSRSLLAVFAMAILGVAALGYLANRYGNIVQSSAPAVERALRAVDEFIVVRRAIHLEIEASADPGPREAAVRRVRDNALTRSGMDPAHYAEVREIYRRWRDGRLQGEMPMARAFERRKAELLQLDLRDYESLDS